MSEPLDPFKIMMDLAEQLDGGTHDQAREQTAIQLAGLSLQAAKFAIAVDNLKSRGQSISPGLQALMTALKLLSASNGTMGVALSPEALNLHAHMQEIITGAVLTSERPKGGVHTHTTHAATTVETPARSGGFFGNVVDASSRFGASKPQPTVH